MPQHAARARAGQLAVIDHQLPVDQHQVEAFRELVRFEESRLILDAGRIEWR